MKRVFSAAVLVPGIYFLTVVPATAQEKSVNPGINKPFENPDLKDYLEKFEGESREIAATANEIVTACKLRPGEVISDVGAGTGLFTGRFAVEVGDKGKVYAVDISPTFLRHIEKTCADSKIMNVETIQCDQFSTKLPKNSVDLVFICETYHHFEFPKWTLQSIHDALRPGGQIILIDFHRIKGKSSDFVMGHVRAGQEVFVREITSAGFKVIGEENELLKENSFVRFQKKEAGESKLDLKGYILGQTYPKLIIYDLRAKKFSEVAYPSAKPNVWYGTEAHDGRHIFLFDRDGAGVIKWDTQRDQGKVSSSGHYLTKKAEYRGSIDGLR